jgi:hypothetical protein
VNIKDEDIDDGSGNVTCAICNSTFDKHLWSHHKQRYHNNLAWRVGDAPLVMILSVNYLDFFCNVSILGS